MVGGSNPLVPTRDTSGGCFQPPLFMTVEQLIGKEVDSVQPLQEFRNKKRLGQNFLRDDHILHAIIRRAALDSSDVVLEVGSGQGVLTKALLSSGCRYVHSVEIDRGLEPFLAPLEAAFPGRATILWGDVLEIPLGTLAPRPTKIVANIPYNITTPLLWRLLEELPGTDYYLLMVQKEAADRIIAPPRTKERYPLGVTLGVMGTSRSVLKVPPAAFRPVPKVESRVIEIALSGRYRTLPGDGTWREMLRTAFSQRRKKFLNNMRRRWPTLPWEDMLEVVCVDGNARAEELTGEQWLALWELLRAKAQ